MGTFSQKYISTMYLSRLYSQRIQVHDTNPMVTRKVQATTQTKQLAHAQQGRGRGFLRGTSWIATKEWTLTAATVTSGAMGTASNMSSWRAVWLGDSLRGGTHEQDMSCVNQFYSVFHTSPTSVRASPGVVLHMRSCTTYRHQKCRTINAEIGWVSWASNSGMYKFPIKISHLWTAP